MWKTLLSFITGGGLSGIAKELRLAHQDKLTAQNDEQRLEAEERLETLNIRKEIIVQSQKDKFERWIRILFAIPFVLYVWKLIVWDKLLELGVTDPLSPTLEYILWTVLGGYFADAVATKLRGK